MSATRRWRHAAAVGAILVAANTAHAVAAPQVRHPSGNVTATRPDGRQYASDPVLHAGDVVELTMTGFRPSTDVTGVLVPESLRHEYRADRHGVIRFRYVVPSRLQRGAHDLVLAAEPTRTQSSVPVQPRPSHTVVRPNIRATVPPNGQFPFRIVSGNGVSGASGSASPTRSRSGSVGRPGNTGFDVLAFVAVGLLVVVGGVAVLRLGRRRRGAPTHG